MGDASGWHSARSPVPCLAHVGAQQSLKEWKKSVGGGEILLGWGGGWLPHLLLRGILRLTKHQGSAFLREHPQQGPQIPFPCRPCRI